MEALLYSVDIMKMTEYQSVYNMKKKENFICITDRKIILDLKMEVIHQSNVPLGSICTKGEEKNKNQDKTNGIPPGPWFP